MVCADKEPVKIKFKSFAFVNLFACLFMNVCFCTIKSEILVTAKLKGLNSE